MNDLKNHEFVSFDGGVKHSARLALPETVTSLTAEELSTGSEQFIARGGGMSMAALSFNQGVTSVETSQLDRIESLDAQRGVVVLEPGVRVGPFLDFVVENGFYVPILPGYQTIEIGGCVAVDVHGKNHLKDGTFINQVLSLEMVHPDHGNIRLSRSENPDLFELTCGGFGLTGTIVKVELKVVPLPCPTIDTITEELVDIGTLPEVMIERARKCDFIFSWHDFVQAGSKFGRGFVKWGAFSSSSRSQDKPTERLVFPIRQTKTYSSPLTLTSENRGSIIPAAFGYATTGLMNAIYNHTNLLLAGPPLAVPVQRCTFPNKLQRDLYFHLFGKTGFCEQQSLIPSEKFSEWAHRVKWWLSRNELPVTIATAKMFEGKQKLLRFNGNGICFAMNFPRCQNSTAFLEYLDQLTVELGCLPYLCKDSRLPRWVVEKTYPEFETFRRRLHEFDPKRRCQSELSRRLSL
ncbi:MAG: FAD-binding oxidoreductase [Cyanobacteria bacterium]|nr:FAD-binding oxidoreductase [Cyanobacteriota bacterium]